jgi:hypothetical protein
MSEASHTGFLGSNRSRLIAALAFVTGLLIAAVIILIVSRTTFTAQTTTEPNTWSTGNVVLTNDHAGSDVFTAQNIKPGDDGAHEVQVTYEGTLTSDIRMFGQNSTGSPGLAGYIHILITSGTTSGATATPVYNGTLAGLEGDWSTGHGSWTAPRGDTTPQVRYYNIEWTLDPATPNSMQGQTATTVFTWEARAV